MSPAVRVLFLRDLRLFAGQPSRVVGALAQPLLFWVVLGAGLAPSFRVPGAEDGPGYMEFFFPGVVLMMLLFSSISATMSVIEDRHRGFLQGVLVAPGGRGAVALGKVLGGAAVGLIHALLLLLLAPLAGYGVAEVCWPAVLLALALASLGLTGLGFALAWRIDSTSGYHVVMSVVLLPLWALSGALFPLEPTHPVLLWSGRVNPVGRAMAALRKGFEGGACSDALPDLAILAALAAAALAAAVWTTRRR